MLMWLGGPPGVVGCMVGCMVGWGWVVWGVARGGGSRSVARSVA